jgi:carboxylesterase
MNAAAAPFALGDGPDACLLLHGLTGAPSEVRPLGEALAAAGLRAVGPLLPGHGTSPRDLAAVDRADLLAFAASQLAELRGARRVFMAGLSAGALLSLRLAAREQRDGVPPIAAEVPLDADAPQRQSLPPGMREDGSYSAIPLSWGRELRLLSDEALADAPRVRAPALLLHGGLDRTASSASARLLAGRLGSAAVRLRIFPQSGHVLPRDRDSAEVCRAVVSFFREA